MTYRRKLIEVSLPLEAIHKEFTCKHPEVLVHV